MRFRITVVSVAAALLASSLSAQSIVTVAGGGIDDGRPATQAALSALDVAVDPSGSIYIADFYNYRIRRVSPSGVITTAIGSGSNAAGGNNIPPAGISMESPTAVVVDGAGNILYADPNYHRIRKLSVTTGIVTTIAGTGSAGSSGDSGPATAAQLNDPEQLAVDQDGNVLIADTGNHKIRKVDRDGTISTLAGTGTAGYGGDNGNALSALLSSPQGIVVAPSGDIYISDTGNHRIRRIRNGTISTIAGTGSAGFSGDGSPASSAMLNAPRGIDLDAASDLYVADNENRRIRKIDASGTISTVAGGGSGFDEGRVATTVALEDPSGVAIDGAGNILIADGFGAGVRRVNKSDQTIHTVAGNGEDGQFGGGDGGPPTAAGLHSPRFVAVDAQNNLYISETFGYRVRKVNRTTNTIGTIAGTGDAGSSGDDGSATDARVRPNGIVFDSLGNLYIADGHRIRKVFADTQIIRNFAGSSSSGPGTDDGPVSDARFNEPLGIAYDATRNFLYIADSRNHKVRRIDLGSMMIKTVAGSGTVGYSGDDALATAAQLNTPNGVAVDTAGDLYIADLDNHRIRKVSFPSGVITTVAGSGGNREYGGDGGLATLAKIARPRSVFVDENQNIYIGDAHNQIVRKVDAAGTITTIAGTPKVNDFLGDGGPATQARLADPQGVVLDSNGNLYIADSDNNRIRGILTCVSVGSPSLSTPVNGALNVALGPTLRWNRVEGAFRYDVYLDTNPNPTNIVAADVTATSVTLSNLLPGTKYYWRVAAKGDRFCENSSESRSQVISFTTISGCSAPAAFELATPGDAVESPSPVTLSWQPSANARTYDLFVGTSVPPPLHLSTPSTSATISGLAPGTTYRWFVRARAACDKTTTAATRTFRVSGICTQASPFQLQLPQADATNVSTNASLSWTSSANASSYDVYFGTSPTPALLLADLTKTSITIPALLPRQKYYWRVEAKAICNGTSVQSVVSSFTTGEACELPGTPSITFVPPGNVGAGQTYVVAWSDAPRLDADGTYLVERAIDPTFATIVDSQQLIGNSASFAATATGIYHHRVRAINACSPTTLGPASPSRAVNVVAATPNVVFTVQPQPAITTLGDKLEFYKSTFLVENISSTPVQVILGRSEIKSIPFFNVVDPSGADAAFITLEPKKPRIFEIRYSGPSKDEAGAYQGVIFFAPTGQGPSLAITPYAFVSLKVGGGETVTPRFLLNGSPTEYVFFPGHAGDDAQRPAISVTIDNPGSTPMELAAEIGPEVWLRPVAEWNAQPIAPGRTRVVELFTDRSRAPNGSAFPRYTYFTIRSKTGASARLLVQDNDALAVTSTRGAALPAGIRSYIIPEVLTAISPGGPRRASTIRVSNVSGDSVVAELIFTPTDQDGFNGSGIRKASVVIPPNDVVTLTDPLTQIFGLPAGSSGQIEIRMPQERFGLLNVTASIFSTLPNGDTFGHDVPVFFRGEGARVDSPHSVPGITSTNDLLTQLTLVETSGFDDASVRVALFDRDGARKQETVIAIPRYGRKEIADVVAVLGGGAAIEGGRVELSVESGGGTVAAFAAVKNTKTGGAASYVGEPLSGANAAKLFHAASFSLEPANGSTVSVVIPSVVNGAIGPSSTTLYRTVLGLSAPRSGPATFNLTFRSLAGIGAPILKNVTVPAGKTVEYKNALEEVFGLTSGAKDEGIIFAEMIVGARMYAGVALTNTNYSSVTVASPVVQASSVTLTSAIPASQRPLYYDGFEQSIDDSRGTRWSVLLSEVRGRPLNVTVRLYEAGNRTLPIAEKEFSIGTYQQLKLETIFKALELETVERRKDRVNVLAMIVPSSGDGLICAAAIAIDNRTGDRKTYLMTPSGGVPATGITRSPVAPVESTKRSRAVRRP